MTELNTVYGDMNQITNQQQNTNNEKNNTLSVPDGVKVSDDVKKFLTSQDPKKPPRSENIKQKPIYNPKVEMKEQPPVQEPMPPPIQSTQERNIKEMDDKTPLPQQHVPVQTIQHQMDEQIQPTYIPQQPQFIPQPIPPQVHHKDATEELYESLQVPLIVGVLFFILQLPWVNSFLYQSFPSLFTQQNKPTLLCLTLKSIIFSVIFYIFTYILQK